MLFVVILCCCSNIYLFKCFFYLSNIKCFRNKVSFIHLFHLSSTSFCRSWDEFHDCANLAMAGCPEEAAAVWESLRQESKKMQFSGNLYDMCSNRKSHSVASSSPHGSQKKEEVNQESLRGHADHLAGDPHALVSLSPLLLLLLWI